MRAFTLEFITATRTASPDFKVYASPLGSLRTIFVHFATDVSGTTNTWHRRKAELNRYRPVLTSQRSCYALEKH